MGRTGSKAADDYYETYAEYARTLRNWFVAYGIGGPLLLVTDAPVAQRLGQSAAFNWVIYLFLFAILVQLLLVVQNKWVSWAMHSGATDPERQAAGWYETADWLHAKFGIDVACDLLSAAALLTATLLALVVLP